MEVYNFYYKSSLSFNILPVNKINKSKSILIQIFSGISSRGTLEKIVEEIKVFFPKAILVGATTSGEILNGKLSSHKILISITTFKKSIIESFSIEDVNSSDSYAAGEYLGRKVNKKNLSLLLLFTDGVYVNPEEFLEGLKSNIDKKTPIVGAVAGDNYKYTQTLIIHNEKIFSKGAVAIAFIGKELEVKSLFQNNWRSVGVDLHITSSYKNIVYEINSTPATELFKHYLGNDFLDGLPNKGLELSLLFEKKEIRINRNIVSANSKGEVVFAGNVPQNSICKFAYIDINNSHCLSDKIDNMEVFYIFCGIGYKKFLKDINAKNSDLFSNETLAAGFFGYGEYVNYRGENIFQNNSCVVVGLREKSKEKNLNSVVLSYKNSEECIVQKALGNLITVTGKELDEKSKQLQELLSFIPNGIIYFDKNLHMTLYNKRALNMLNIDTDKENFKDLNTLDKKWVVNIFKETILKKEKITGGAVTTTSSGKEHYVRVKTTPIINKNIVIGAIALILN